MLKRGALAGMPAGMASWMAIFLWLIAWPAQAAIDVTATGATPLGPHAELFEDATGELELADVLARSETLSWAPSGQQVIDIGFSSSAWWLRFGIENDAPVPVRRMLELASPLPDYVDVYAIDGQGRVVQQWHTGSRRPFMSRPIRHRTFVLPLYLGPNETRELYLRLDSHDGLLPAAPLYLMNDAEFLDRTQRELMGYSLFYGGLLALLIYNLLTFLATRERAFLYSVFYLGAFFLFNFGLRGFAYQFMWPERPHLNGQLLLLSGGLLTVALTLFSVECLGLRRHAPRMARGIVVLTGLIVACVLPALANHFAWVLRALIPLGIAYAALLLGVAAWLGVRRDRLALIYLAAWTSLLSGSGLFLLGESGVMAYEVSQYALESGAALGFLLLAFGLAVRINRLKRDKLAAERETYKLQRSLNRKLEDEVQQRTRELERANRKLEAMVRTDPLTGLLNRRQFESLVNEEIHRRQRDAKPLLFAMMDIDDFKLYNDTYGHQAGDEVLVEVARLLSSHFRRAGDRLFRLGGEEFGILLEADSFEAGRFAMERFRHDLQQLKIPHERSRHGVITGSFGLVCCDDYGQVPNAMALYEQADQAMYQAKEESRNRVVTRSLLLEA
ncbi:diguanylate cyclase [Billgrantia saliphila]|uniref:diguanylate cyclase n=1 Tax=Billgrantia saliphila TaxID=1848458 RepID=UPI0012DE0CD2|nr:diguanylate cyclase [Halomonas saliphila]